MDSTSIKPVAARDDAGGAPPSNSGLHIVIPVRNGIDYMPALIDSLLVQSERPERIHVIDNGSAAAQRAREGEFPALVSVRLVEKSLGFGAACNLGLRDALDAGAAYVMILNQDLVIETTACEVAVDALSQHEDFGLMGLFQLSYDGKSLDPPFRGMLPVTAIDDAMCGKLQDVYECDFVPAAAIILRSETLKRLGGFDSLYFMYQEDKDLCLRIRRAGLKVGIATSARVRHDCGQHRVQRNAQWYANWYYSRTVYHLKWSPRPLAISFLTLAKYILPRWNLGEAYYWVRGALRCLRHLPELRRRREPRDGLELSGGACRTNEHTRCAPGRWP